MGKARNLFKEALIREAKIEKRVKLFDLEDGTQVVVTKDTDTDADAIVKIKIYTEVKGEVFISFEVPLHCENTEKQNVLFNNDEKLKDFAIGVYNNQMPQLDENFKTI